MTPRNPAPTVDIIVELTDQPNRSLVLVERKNEPKGFAIPGGFIDYGESAEQAAVREAKEELGLDVELLEQFHVYSDPNRDSRKHTLSIVFLARAEGKPKAGDDAKNVEVIELKKALDRKLCFDHERILKDYYSYKEEGKRPPILPSDLGKK